MNTRDRSELRRAVLRLALQFTAVIVIVLVLVGALVYAIVAAGLQESSNKTLAGATLIDSPSDAPVGVFVAMYDDGQLVESRDIPNGLPDNAAIKRVAATKLKELSVVKAAGRAYSVLTIQRSDRIIQAAIDQHEGQEELNRLMLAMLTAVGTSAVLAAGLSLVMARRAMRPMAESLALQRRFVADASHELRTPLTLLSTRAQLLRRKFESETPNALQKEVTSGLGALVEDAKMLTGILDDLLLSADPRESVGHSTRNLVAIAAHATALAEPEAHRRSIRLSRSSFPEVINVRGSEVALGRVFTALIANALDHAETSVDVEVSVKGSDAIIRVCDDGPGFPPDARKRVFERFASTRSLSESSGEVRHYGLGLALVAEIVTLHDGKVMVEPSSAKRGSVIKILMPLAKT